MIDINLSPDIPAYWCYLIVWVLGFLVARRRIATQLAGRAGVWHEPRVHLLLFVYSILPVLLFWFLDRGGAIADTALVAALTVGLGYQQVLAAREGEVKASADASRFMAMFQAYADPIAQAAMTHIEARVRQHEDRLVRTISRDDSRVEKLVDIARSRHPNADIIDDQLKRITPSPPGNTSLFMRERKVRVILALMLSIPDRDLVLRDAGVVPRWRLWIWSISSFMRLWRAYYLVFYGIAIAVVILGQVHGQNTPSPELQYHVWRVGKVNSTQADQYRSRESLIGLLTGPTQADGMASEPPWPGSRDLATQTAAALGRQLRQPGLPVERVDLILQILLEARSSGGIVKDIDHTLIEALRVGSLDARRRINDAIRTLAETVGAPLSDQLKAWEPTKGDTVALLERRVGEWRAFWDAVDTKNGAPASK